MDKYQCYIMKKHTPSLYGKCFSPQGDVHGFKVVWDDSYIITLYQHENITFLNYVLYIQCEAIVIDSIFAIRKGEQIKLKNGDEQILTLPIDFDDRFDSLKIVFKDNLADDVIVPLVYKEADKNAYYAHIEHERRVELLKNANIKISTGSDLVNIYFQPCNSAYSKTIIELYTATGSFKQNNITGPIPIFDGMNFAPPKLLGGTIDMKIGQFKVEADMFFKSITGLAHGVYAIKLIQFDKNNNELIKSDELFFVIR